LLTSTRRTDGKSVRFKKDSKRTKGQRLPDLGYNSMNDEVGNRSKPNFKKKKGRSKIKKFILKKQNVATRLVDRNLKADIHENENTVEFFGKKFQKNEMYKKMGNC
jgi:hypothetical protein